MSPLNVKTTRITDTSGTYLVRFLILLSYFTVGSHYDSYALFNYSRLQSQSCLYCLRFLTAIYVNLAVLEANEVGLSWNTTIDRRFDKLLAYQYLIKRRQSIQQIKSDKGKLQYLAILKKTLLRFTLHWLQRY